MCSSSGVASANSRAGLGHHHNPIGGLQVAVFMLNSEIKLSSGGGGSSGKELDKDYRL